MIGSAPRRGRRLAGPRAAVLAVALALGGAELALRAAGYGNPRLVEPSETRGWRLAPGQVVRGPRGTEERIDGRGYREREWPAAGAPRGPCIVVLGDSVAYGVGVDARHAWPRLLERALVEAGHPGLEVWCLATPGYTLGQMLGAWAEDGRELEPQVVIVELSATHVRPTRPLREPRSYPLAGLVRRSALWDWLRRASLAKPSGAQRAVEERLLDDPADPANEPLWSAAERRLDALREELAARGARLVVAATPRVESALDPAREEPRWRAWAAARPDVAYVSSASALARARAPFDAERLERGREPAERSDRNADAEAMELQRAGASCFFLDDPRHLTERGHRVVAELLRAAVEPLLR